MVPAATLADGHIIGLQVTPRVGEWTDLDPNRQPNIA
jgi:hypothetical protein